MDDKKIMVESLFEKFKEYVNTSLELYKLKTIEKASDVFSTLAVRLCILTIFSVFFLFLNIGGALWLGELLGKVYYGFFIISLVYLLLFFYLLVTRRQMKEKVTNSIIKHSLK